eukprot:g17241.t1
MANTGAVRSSALGTRIAAVAPPPFSTVPETIPISPASQTWGWNKPESAPRADASKASRTARRAKSTRPTSAPLRRRSADAEVTPESNHHRKAGPGNLRQAVVWDDEALGRKKPVMAARVRVGQRRARPASAQPSSRAPSSPSPASTGGTPMASRRLIYRARRLPPPWDDNSSAGGSNGSGGAGGGRRRYGRRRGRAGASAPAESLKFGGSVSNARDWDCCGDVGLGPAARRAVAAKAAAASSAKSEAAAIASTHPPPWPSPESGRARGGAAGAGRPYMSRAERAAEESKEMARLREEVEQWRQEAGVARAEAIDARKRLESQEESVATVLYQTAEVMPTYRYGLDLTDAVAGSRTHGPSGEPPQLAILEHRRELEKSLVIRRLRGQMSRLSERLVAAEGELTQLKRSCQFTALAEMLSAGEEYVKEVERLRARIGGDAQLTTDKGVPIGRRPSGALLSRVVDIPSATGSKSKSLVKRRSSRGAGDTDSRSNSGDDHILVSPTSKSMDRNPEEDGQRRCSSPDLNRPSERPSPAEEDPTYGTNAQTQPSCPREQHQQQHQQQQQQQQQQQRQRQRYGQQPSTNSRRRNGGGRGRRRSRHGGEALVSSRARAGLLGILAPGGSRGYLTIDAPIATLTSGKGSSGHASVEGVDARDVGTTGQGGRVGVTTEMEIDVMKGLVLAQHQRIERQRSRMQELERDLRDYRRAAMVGDEWPEAPWARQPSPPAWKGGLTPSRSAPAGLDRLTGLRAALFRQTTDKKTRAVRGRGAASSPPRHYGRSKAFSPENLRGHEERRTKPGASCLGHDGNNTNNHSFRSWPEGFSDTRLGFLSGGRPTFLSSTGSFYSAAAANVNRDNSSSRPRPRTATAAGRARAEAWRNADVSSGSGSGTGAASKRRPRSASSRFHTSPGRDRVRETAEWGTSSAEAVGEGRSGDVAARMGLNVDGVTGLPDGWAEAVDEESGHVYYYSDKRSTWIKPSVPASPRIPDDGCNGAGSTAGTIPGVGGGDGAAAPLSAHLVAAATDLAGALRQAAEATEAMESTEERGGEGRGKAGERDPRGGSGKGASDAELRSGTPSLDAGYQDEASDSPSVGIDSTAAAMATAGQEVGEAKRLGSDSTACPRPSNLEEPGADGIPMTVSDHGRHPEDPKGGNGPNILEIDVSPLHPRWVALPSGGDSAKRSGQLQKGGEMAPTEPEIVDRGEAEPPRPSKLSDATVNRTAPSCEESQLDARPESDDPKAVNTSSSRGLRGTEEEDREAASIEEGARFSIRSSVDGSPQQALRSSEALPGGDASSLSAVVDSKHATAVRNHHHDRGEKQDQEDVRSSNGHAVDESSGHRPQSDPSRTVNGGTAAAPTAEQHVPLANEIARPFLSQEETEDAMAALIAKLRQPPSAEHLVQQESSTNNNATAAVLGEAVADSLATDHETEGHHSLEAYQENPATKTSVMENNHPPPSGAPEEAVETNVLESEEGKGVVAETLDSRASEAVDGMYEDDFDDD